MNFHLRPSTFHLLIAGLLLAGPAGAQDDLTLNLNYPLPRGVYKALRAVEGLSVGTQSPAPSAILEVSSTTRGFLPPRLSTAERNAIPTPAAGLIIYNTNTRQLEVFDGTAWGVTGGAGGWTDDGTVVRLTTGTDDVGVGTTSPQTKLDVAGTLQLRRLADAGPQLLAASSHVLAFQGAYWTGTQSSSLVWYMRNAVYGSTVPSQPQLIIFDPSGIASLAVSPDGSLGVGTSGVLSPGAAPYVYVQGAVTAERFEDRDDPAFFLDPAGTSVLSQVCLDLMRDREDLSYVLDPSQESVLSSVRVEQSMTVEHGTVPAGASPPISAVRPLLEVKGGLRLDETGLSRPVCNPTRNGTLWFTQADSSLWLCASGGSKTRWEPLYQP